MQDTLVVNGVTYVPEADVSPSTGVHIVVLQRGWVVVGRYQLPTDSSSDVVTLTDASVIRYWGTTKGLGELVNGPTSKTKLDKAGTVRFHMLTTVLVLKVDDDAWEDKL